MLYLRPLHETETGVVKMQWHHFDFWWNGDIFKISDSKFFFFFNSVAFDKEIILYILI